MSVLIKGMKMPTSCFYCPFREKVNPDDYVCMALNKEFEETFSLIVGKRHKDCPLVTVPPHGRLIDADELYEKISLLFRDVNSTEDFMGIGYNHGVGDALAIIKNFLIIIEAEGGEDHDS